MSWVISWADAIISQLSIYKINIIVVWNVFIDVCILNLNIFRANSSSAYIISSLEIVVLAA